MQIDAVVSSERVITWFKLRQFILRTAEMSARRVHPTAIAVPLVKLGLRNRDVNGYKLGPLLN